MSRDVLAIPGVSVSVEHLFSLCKHTLTGGRASMSVKTAAQLIVLKEWCKALILYTTLRTSLYTHGRVE